MSLGLFEILALLSFACVSATFDFQELNPDLEKYQDASMVYPLTEPFYELYRNYEEDPIFAAYKCLKFSPVGAEEDGIFPIIAQFGEDNLTVSALVKLQASEGYTVNNIVTFAANGESESMPLYIAFMDVESCGVVRVAYISESACAVVVPESRLGQSTVACDFVYDLLCGTTRYQIYDDSCKN